MITGRQESVLQFAVLKHTSLFWLVGYLLVAALAGSIDEPGKKIVFEDPHDLEVQENGDSENDDHDPENGGSLLSIGGGINGDAMGDEGTPLKYIKCKACDPPLCEVEYECADAIICWKSRNVDSFGYERISRGCILPDTEKITGIMCNTRAHAKPSKQAHNTSKPDYDYAAVYVMDCCSDRDYCNDGEFPDLPSARHEELNPKHDSEILHIVVGLAIVFGVFAVIIISTIQFFRKTHKKRMNELMKEHQEQNFFPLTDDQLHAKSAGDSTLKEYLDGSMTSGSGSGLPLLVQRTLAKNIQLIERIGKGRYGTVWKGLYNCEFVAVKSFPTIDEASWIRETEIYSTVMLRHNNILGFYGSDMTSINSTTELWLVTHYHRNGSLYDYLNKWQLSQTSLIKLAYTLANGLEFLHREMDGTESRPGIAHRDIKSKNILVSANETCVIADFGLAVTCKRGELTVAANPRVGTKRYMAPELLCESINMSSFDAFKRVDMYAFSLVLWEMCRRTLSQGIADDYQPPYYDAVNSDPSFDEMRKVVCVDSYRPEIPNRWHSDQVLMSFSKIMKECWHEKPSVRLPVLRVKKTIYSIAATSTKKSLLDIITV